MAIHILNPSFETPGGEPGHALDWIHIATSSVYSYGTFARSVATVVVDQLVAEPGTGVSVQHQSDGTVFLISAPGTAEAFEGHEFGWKANQFFKFAMPSSHLEAFRVSTAKEKEEFEDGWGLDEMFVAHEAAKINKIRIVIPIGIPSLITNAFVGYRVELSGRYRTVVSNNADTFNVDVPFDSELFLTDTVGPLATGTTIPLVTGGLLGGEFFGKYARINDNVRLITGNTTTQLTVSPAFFPVPITGEVVQIVEGEIADGASVRLVGGPNNDVGFLNDLSLVITDGFTEQFNAGWPWKNDLIPEPAPWSPGVFHTDVPGLFMGTFDGYEGTFDDGLLYAGSEYANSFILKVHRFGFPGDEGIIGPIVVSDTLIEQISTITPQSNTGELALNSFFTLVAAGTTTSRIQIETRDLNVDAFKGKIALIGGVARGVAGNTGNSLVLTTPLDIAPATGTRVQVQDPPANSGYLIGAKTSVFTIDLKFIEVLGTTALVDIFGEPGPDLERGLIDV